jgi:SNF family Na+-dependent transporter
MKTILPCFCLKLFTGVFLIPYFVMLAIEGIPIFYLELAIGERLRKVPLVYGTKCHPTSAVWASAVLSCLSMLLCTTIP